MKKSKILIEPRIKFLNRYFENFKNKDILINKHLELNINYKNLSDFQKSVYNEYKLIACGKQTKLFWTQRQFSDKEADELTKKYKRVYDKEKSPMNINHWINKGFSKEDAEFKIKSQRKQNIEYWINKGYSKELSEIKRKEYQSIAALSFKTMIRNNPNDYNDIRPNQVNYWIKKGYSKEDSLKKVSEIQSTFSKEKCIEKYGYIEGIKIWQDRQVRWINSLENGNYDMKQGKSITIRNKINNYDIDTLIDSLTLKNPIIFKILLKECLCIEDFVSRYMEYFNENDEISLYRIVRPIFSIKLLNEYYNTNKEHILSLLIPKITRIKTKYSYISWFNGHICRSDAEYIIANFLFKNNIKYKYEKYYENSKKRCDFYLIEYDLYIEYLGMRYNSYKTKIDFLDNNNINYIISDDVEELKLKIKNYVNNKN